MMLSRLLLAGLALLSGLPGCTVYAPMQPTMPLVRQRGQAEVGASLQALGRVEATAAYSPLPHVVVAGGLTGSPRLGNQHFLTTAQAEAGIGAYQALGPRWLLSGLGGVGRAYSHRGYVDLGIFGPGVYSEYEASYRKVFGQLGLAHVEANDTYSLTYRLTQVQFNYLNDADYGPLPLSTMLRHELAFAAREQVGAHPRWQLVYTAGLSVSGTPRQERDLGYPTFGRPEYHANRNLLPAFLLSVGAVYRLGAARP